MILQFSSLITHIIPPQALLYHFSRIAGAESLRVEAFHDLLKAPPSAEPDKGFAAPCAFDLSLVSQCLSLLTPRARLSHPPTEQQHAFSQNTLYLRFRDVPDYFLAIEIEEQDFTPKFYLLVTKYVPMDFDGDCQ
mgnify:CR=1 FL=1